MKKSLLLFTVISLIVMAVFSCSCSPESASTSEKTGSNSNIITLDLSNYEYYLSINDVALSSVSAAGGTVFAVSREVTVSGAVHGLYRDCSLYYKVGDGNEREVKLNAAGYAKFEYTNSRNSNRKENTWGLSFVRVKGTIVL